MPIADLDKRRAYDRERGRKRYKTTRIVVTTSCEICGAALHDRRRKICGSPECKRRYKQQWQKAYDARPGAAEKRTRNLDKSRARDRARRRREQNPDEFWAWNLKYFHSMYPEQWHAMWEDQNGLCYLGNHPLPEDRKKVAIDHDHSHCPSGRSCGICRRGLACSNCNTAIGFLLDDPALLRLVADNLERAKELTAAVILSAPKQEELLF